MESWKRRQSTYEQKFGMNATSHAGEELRPEFTQKATKIRSYVTGECAVSVSLCLCKRVQCRLCWQDDASRRAKMQTISSC